MTAVLVTGGAGYVGSHSCKALAASGFVPVSYDNLSRGHRHAVKWGPLEIGDIRDRERLDAVLCAHRPAAILHCAAFAYVGESVADPALYYDNNVTGSLVLLEAARPQSTVSCFRAVARSMACLPRCRSPRTCRSRRSARMAAPR